MGLSLSTPEEDEQSFCESLGIEKRDQIMYSEDINAQNIQTTLQEFGNTEKFDLIKGYRGYLELTAPAFEIRGEFRRFYLTKQGEDLELRVNSKVADGPEPRVVYKADPSSIQVVLPAIQDPLREDSNRMTIQLIKQDASSLQLILKAGRFPNYNMEEIEKIQSGQELYKWAPAILTAYKFKR